MMSAASRALHRSANAASSAAVSIEPVGLFGLTASTARTASRPAFVERIEVDRPPAVIFQPDTG